MSFRALDIDFEEVIIIDLLSEAERRKFQISEDLRSDLAALGIPQFHLSCYNKDHVFQALNWSADRLRTANFVLHFTAHGNKDGIGLKATNEFIPWQELRGSLQNLNKKMEGNLIVNMMACKGISGVSIQSFEDPAEPFFGIIGPVKDIDIFRAKAIGKTFYEKMLNGIQIPTIVLGINNAEGETVLWCNSSQLRRGAGQQLSL